MALQARILDWVAIPLSRGSSWPRNQTQVSCIVGRFCCFPYFLQIKSEFGNKEFIIWATVSSLSCFCWLCQLSSVQSLSCVRLFVTPWIAAHQAHLSITNSRSSLRLTSIESVMPSSHLILCCPLLLLLPMPPSIRVFSNESTLSLHEVAKLLVSALASFLPKNTQDWFPLKWTG